MQTPVKIRRWGTVAEVSMPDESPLHPSVIGLLVPHMTYNHVELLRGQDRVDPITGVVRNVHCHTVYLYAVQDGRRLVTCYGYLPRMFEIFAKNQIEIIYEDVTPPSPRPDAYTPRWENLPAVEFRYRQQDCLQRITESEGGQVIAVPAFGKTFMFAMIARLYPKARIAIVTKSRDIAGTIVNRLREHLPNVGIMTGGMHKKGRVTVYTADSLHHADGEDDFLLIDEGHQLVTEHYAAKIAGTFMRCRTFMFTATPDGRMDNADAKLEYLCGPRIFELGWEEALANGLVVPIEVRWIPIVMDHNPAKNKTGVPKKRWGIWRNDYRNERIAEAVRQHPDDQVLILVETVEHAVHLGQYLPEFTLVYGKTNPATIETYKRNGLLPPNYEQPTPNERARYRTEFEACRLKKVIATDVWATGVSFEQLAVLVRADGRQSENMSTQANSRVNRLHNESGKRLGIVYDCMDYFDQGLQNGARARSRVYARNHWQQVKPLKSRAI